MEFQSPAGDSLSCDRGRGWKAEMRSISCFNRPQAIRCLATQALGLPEASGTTRFQSPAGDSLSCDHPMTDLQIEQTVAFQSPAGDSLSCDPKSASHTDPVPTRFNRPQAIRCLATRPTGRGAEPNRIVSIARRRFVVLRLNKPTV